jgi:hypothetical protein
MKTSKFLSLFAWLMLVLFSAGVAAQQAAEPTVHRFTRGPPAATCAAPAK